MSKSKLLAKRDDGSDFASSSLKKWNGGITIYSHDMGSLVESFIGDDEYEYFYTVKAENIKELAAALCREQQMAAAPSGSSEQHIDGLVQAELVRLQGQELDFVFRSLFRKFKGKLNAPDDFSKFCEQRGIPVEFSSWP
jgi:hypothetical protein